MKYYRLQNYTNTNWIEYRTDGMQNSISEKIVSVESQYGVNHDAFNLRDEFTLLGFPNRVGDSVTAAQLTALALANNMTLTKLYESEAGVSLNAALNSEALITSFSFLDADNDAFTGEDVVGVIDDELDTIALEVPALTVVTALIATFTTSAGAVVTIGVTAQVSGTTENDFTAPVEYIVTAEDEVGTKTYTVTVTVAS